MKYCIEIQCGSENLNGKLKLAPIDEINVSADFIEELFYDGRCIKAEYDEKWCGFVQLGKNIDCVMACTQYTCSVFYSLDASFNCIDKDDIAVIIAVICEYFKDNELTVKVIFAESDIHSQFEPSFAIEFYARITD